jgi:hypothetical protein
MICMHGIGTGQESKVRLKRTKLGRRTGLSMTFMRMAFC